MTFICDHFHPLPISLTLVTPGYHMHFSHYLNEITPFLYDFSQEHNKMTIIIKITHVIMGLEAKYNAKKTESATFMS